RQHEGAEDDVFDKKKTLPGRPRPDPARFRQHTLKSASSVRREDDVSLEERVPPPSAGGEPEPGSTPRTHASTQPDGKLREARHHALGEGHGTTAPLEEQA